MPHNTSLLEDCAPAVHQKIGAITRNALETIIGANVVKIMKKNPYEKMIPFNLWFYHPKYSINDIFENNQHMRVRMFSESMMTPIMRNEYPELVHLKSFLGKLSLYQPFYPETFYNIWEFLCMDHGGEFKNFLHIGQEHSLGTMEALVFYHEKYQTTYQYNNYDCIISSDEPPRFVPTLLGTQSESFDPFENYYSFSLPPINYLGQAYKIRFLENSGQLQKYDFISIDVCHRLDNIFKWTNEEMDLQCSLFYLISVLKHLNKNGALLLRLNLIGLPSWTIIFDLVHGCFKEHTIHRASVSNPFNSEVYLFLNKFEDKPWLGSFQYRFYKQLYQNKVYSRFFLNYHCTKENPIYKKYELEIKNWCEQLSSVLKNFNSEKTSDVDCITNWHISNGLKQISDANAEFDDNAFKGLLKTSAKKFVIKLVLPSKLYELIYYEKLTQKRAELNYYKRVMDTKPSQIFIDRSQANRQTYLLCWDYLTSKIDVYRNIKSRLKNQYNAEMATNAFIKMYEMLSSLPKLFSSNRSSIKTFHICEAPGAFIAAMNHFLSNKKIKWEWYAQTLKPQDNSDLALEDHFGFISSYSDCWLFGKDGTGDITHSSVIKSYASDPRLKHIDFMTADAGLKCNPVDLNEQEAYLGKINMGQIICILACLSIGKSAIFKTFLPMAEPLTLSMMYLLTHVFDSIQLVKPATSHSYNSEVYVVLSGYKGINKKQLEVLYVLLDDPNTTSKSLLFPQIDRTFFKTYTENVGKVIDRQIASLSRNYYYYYHFNEIHQLDPIREQCITKWFQENPISVLDENKKLLNKKSNSSMVYE